LGLAAGSRLDFSALGFSEGEGAGWAVLDFSAAGLGAAGADSPAAGKRIHEIQLRTQTGASIVGIERHGANLINPGPDEELQAGDQVLLLGNRAQLDSAKAALLPGAAQAEAR